MSRVPLFSLLLVLIVSCAVPTGTVFALSEPLDTTTQHPIEEDGEQEVAEIISEKDLVVPQQPEMLTEQATDIASVLTAPLEEMIEPEVVKEDPNPPIIVPPPVVLPTSPLLITAFKASGAHLHIVQLYNNSSSMVPVDDVTLLYMAGGEEYEISLTSGWIQPRSYVTVAWEGESEHADSTFRFESLGEGILESIELHHPGYQILEAMVPSGYSGDLLHRYKSAAGNYTTNTTFTTGSATVVGGGLYTLPGRPDLSVLEVLVNPKNCIYGHEAADCYDFIKVRNDGAHSIDLSRYRLRSGYSNTSSTATNTAYFDDIVAPGEVRTLTHGKNGERVSFTANDGTVWLEDIYGFESYDLHVSPYIGSNLAAQTGKSWAYNDEVGEWQWAVPSPYLLKNNFTFEEPGKGVSVAPRQLTPCRDNQYRSEETNRCRNIVAPATVQPCREGQYRSEETNRCRSIAATVASVLKPCADDQFRNPATNRCKKIATSDDIALADCGEGRERNPDTNRCRNVLAASTLANTLPFPVEETGSSREDFVGWVALGIVTFVGVSYGIWEWRYELHDMGRKAIRFMGRSK